MIQDAQVQSANIASGAAGLERGPMETYIGDQAVVPVERVMDGDLNEKRRIS